MSDNVKKCNVGVAAYCTVCHKMKQPLGRSAPMETAGAYCSSPFECEGYAKDPKPGVLWPGETREEYGY